MLTVRRSIDVRIKDDRRQPCDLARTRLFDPASGVRRKMRRHTLVASAIGFAASASGIVTSLAFWVYLSASTQYDGDSWKPVVLGCTFGALVGVLVLLLIDRLLLRKSDQRLINQIRATAHCPACGYNLRNLPTEPDHCTLCPECGAAWRLPTLATPAQERNS